MAAGLARGPGTGARTHPPQPGLTFPSCASPPGCGKQQTRPPALSGPDASTGPVIPEQPFVPKPSGFRSAVMARRASALRSPPPPALSPTGLRCRASSSHGEGARGPSGPTARWEPAGLLVPSAAFSSEAAPPPSDSAVARGRGQRQQRQRGRMVSGPVATPGRRGDPARTGYQRGSWRPWVGAALRSVPRTGPHHPSGQEAAWAVRPSPSCSQCPW